MRKMTTLIAIMLVTVLIASQVLGQEEQRGDRRSGGRGRGDGQGQRPEGGQRPDRPEGERGPGGPGGPDFGRGGGDRGGFDPRSGQGPSDRGSMVQRYQEEMARRKAAHEGSVRELEAIKKVAAKENAKKTVALIQKLIDMKNEGYNASVKKYEQMRDQMRQRMEGQGQPGQRPGSDGQRPSPGGERPQGRMDFGQLFDTKDANKDGKLTKEELSGVDSRFPIDKFFENTDADGDGAITKEELKTASEARGRQQQR
ncbi:MAG: hypothetical protein KAR47_08250 [Planctomycetes bacterium]|nr:hypothetical protein [Planctomycetota bacterium]